MKERPILVSGPLVRALLAGTKTQTRRPAKGVDFRGAGGPGGPDWNDPSCWGWADEYGDEFALAADPGVNAIPCPYGGPGDRLWVKETWRLVDFEHDPTRAEPWNSSVEYRADGSRGPRTGQCDENSRIGPLGRSCGDVPRRLDPCAPAVPGRGVESSAGRLPEREERPR